MKIINHNLRLDKWTNDKLLNPGVNVPLETES